MIENLIDYCKRCFCCGKALDFFDSNVELEILTTPSIDPLSDFAEFKRKSICKDCFKHSRVERLDDSDIIILGNELCVYKINGEK